MIRFKPTLFLFGLLFFWLGLTQTFAQKPAQETPALIQAILEHALISEKKVPGYELLKNKNKVVVSRAVINKFISEGQEFHFDLYPRETFPEKVSGITIMPLSKPEIQMRADKKGDYVYLQLGSIYFTGNRAEIGVSTNQAISRKTKNKTAAMGSGYVLEFVKENDAWKFNGERIKW